MNNFVSKSAESVLINRGSDVGAVTGAPARIASLRRTRLLRNRRVYDIGRNCRVNCGLDTLNEILRWGSATGARRALAFWGLLTTARGDVKFEM